MIPEPVDDQEPATEQPAKSNKGLVITVLVLLLAIAAVLVYIAARCLIPGTQNGSAGTDTADPNVTTTAATTTQGTVLEVPCKEITISDVIVELNSAGAIQLLSAKVAPEDTTDELVFTSEDESIATVNKDGKIEAIAPGQTVITVTCGEQTATCRVTCNFEAETTAPSTEAPTDPVYDPSELKLLKNDVTLTKKGETWVCYKGEIPADQIKWSSDNEEVVTVENGKVTAVGKGNTKIHGEYGDVKVSCIVRCSASVGTYEAPEETTEPTQSTRKYHLNTDNTSQKNDITLKVGESFTFRLLDADGKTVEAEFSCSNAGVCAISGSKVTAEAVGTTNVIAEFDGETHTCIVRVSD